MATILPQRVRLVDPATGLIEREWLATLSRLASAPVPAPGPPTPPAPAPQPSGTDLTPRVVALESRVTGAEQSNTTQEVALTALQTTVTPLPARIVAVESVNAAQNVRLAALELGGYQS